MKKKYLCGEVRKPRVYISKKYTDARIPRGLYVLLLGAILSVFLIPLQGHPYRQFATAIGMFGLVVFLFAMLRSVHTPPPGRLRFANRAPLHFPSPLTMRIGILVGSLCAVAFGVLSVLSGPISGEVMVEGAQSGLHVYGVLFGGLMGLGYTIRCGINPIGIELNSRGVRWQHWGSKNEVAWEDIRKVELGILKRSRSIHLCDRKSGGASFIDISVMGSDPVIIAETIAYFLAYPKEREALNDPIAALSLVMDLSEPSELRTRRAGGPVR